MMEFIRWRDEVLRQVRFKPDRKAIREELNGHYEDKVADLERLGYDRKLAEARALESMGNAREIGKAFDKVHKPWLGWLWKITTWLVVFAIAAVVKTGIDGGYYELQKRLGFLPHVVDYQADGKSFALYENEPVITRVFWKSTPQRVERAGTTIELPYMAVWGEETEAGWRYWLEFVITAKDLRFWEDGPQLNGLVLKNSDGRVQFYDWKDDSGYAFSLQRHETPLGMMFTVTMNLKPGTEKWLELTYPYGEPWTFRLNWEEADLK